jgi:hypothetical protein
VVQQPLQLLLSSCICCLSVFCSVAVIVEVHAQQLCEAFDGIVNALCRLLVNIYRSTQIDGRQQSRTWSSVSSRSHTWQGLAAGHWCSPADVLRHCTFVLVKGMIYK